MQSTGRPRARHRPIRRVVVVALTLAVGAALSGCTPPTAPPPPPAPDGITVSVQQDRLDIARGKMTVDVHNDGAASVTVTTLSYSDPRWTSALDWSGTLNVPAGRARSIGVDLLSPACVTSPTDAAGAAHVVFQTDRGAASADYTVDDPFGFVARAVQQGCFASRLAERADVELADATAVTGDGVTVADLEVRISNRGDAPVRIDTVKSTTLLQPADGGWLWTPAQTVAAGQTSTLHLEAVPARCDMHAIAEDKVGTRFDTGISVLTDPADTGTVTLVATDEQRSRLYDFVATSCGFAP